MKMISAILPTRGRQEWAKRAVECFASQTYPYKELIVLDDVDDPSFPDEYGGVLVASDSSLPWLKSFVANDRMTIPSKRNFCCQYAAGDIIMHFDSDDWSDPGRMAAQVHLLEESQKQVSGFHSLLFYVEPSGQCWKYVSDKSFALGTSLAYTREWWAAHPFRPGPDTPNVGEDNEFVKDARNLGELISVDAGRLMVARIHDSNTSVKRLDGAQTSYVPVSVDALPRGFFQK